MYGKQFFIYIIITLSFTLIGCTRHSTPSRNPHDLQLVNSVKAYHQNLKEDTSQRFEALHQYIQPLYTDFRYATTLNFTKTILYHKPVPYLRVAAARALQQVQEELKTKNLSLLIFDAYRPYRVTEKMWEVVPDERYAANPARGSGHNRGAAVDVTLVQLSDGKPLAMPTDYDDFSEKAHHTYQQLEKEVIENRKLLRTVMEKNGFVALETEWWHYSLPNAALQYPLVDLSFKQMKKITKKP